MHCMDNADNVVNSFDQLTLIEFDSITLAFPQNQILTIESLDQINTQLTTERSSGTLIYNASKYPIYTFNSDLEMLAQSTASNRFCIGIKHPEEEKTFAVMCDSVHQYQTEDKTNTTEIPILMHNQTSPIVRFHNKENNLVLISTAESMSNYINSQDTAHQE